MYKKYGVENDSVDIFIKNKDAYIDVDVSKKTTAQVDVNISGLLSDVDKFFKFSQVIASNRWEIRHNLNKYPSVTIVDSAENVVVGDVQYVDKNNVIVTFAASFSGNAYLN